MGTDRWIYRRDDGTVILCIENDGASYLFRGAETVEKEITFKNLETLWGNPRLYDEAKRLLRGEPPGRNVEPSNRHPADRLADARQELEKLQAEIDSLRAYLMEHSEDREGDEHVACVGTYRRKHVDWAGLEREIGPETPSAFHRPQAGRRCPPTRAQA
jgi:hypothetical protein